ncbi:F0F1 ATP synthase subunit alpha [candidate division WWE3 bacterium]|uniref:F0F1 ATP synthase subunit alpha n=1 Tax=candidate division WWE3 bacterium TaxID=2053526 RepID=A0A955RP09_UNCKA|nr:F0F1 ATP synthase subunit alpha [candidate division WWE3 bacterium]
MHDESQKSFESYLENANEVGFVEKVIHPITHIKGLPGVHPEELVVFETGELGQVFSVNEDSHEILLFKKQPAKIGTRVARTQKTLEIPLTNELLGKTISPLGIDVQTGQSIQGQEYRDLRSIPPGISERAKITSPLITGVNIVDLLIPLGKGQRELVIGDRKTGKTNFLLQTMLTQSQAGTICIYAGIGKRLLEIKQVEEFLNQNNIRNNSIIVASSASESIGTIYLTPYTAMTIAEYFRDQGRDVLIILDDLTTHAKYYREISLLANRFPGRSSYPGDMFFEHARLLERAGNFKTEDGKEVSITCLPVAETIEGNISGYIQTNLMSITDGHIFFDNELFAQGRRPAVNYFLSVTRVGRQTQSTIRWGINRELNTFLGFLEKTQSFVHFGAELNEGITTLLSMGEKITSFFNQHMSVVIPINLQVLLFSLIWIGTWQTASKSEMSTDMQQITNKYLSDEEYRSKLHSIIDSAKDFNALLGILSKEGKGLVELAKK